MPKQATKLLSLLLGPVLLASCAGNTEEDDVPLETATLAIPHMSCAYPPPATFGYLIGETIPSTLSWTGYAAGSGEVSEVPITEFYDCDGTREVNAVMFETVGFG